MREARRVLAIRTSPTAHNPADQTNSSDVMQKKLMDWPISNHEPCERLAKYGDFGNLTPACVGHSEEECNGHHCKLLAAVRGIMNQSLTIS